MSGDIVSEPDDLTHGVPKLPDTPGLVATVDAAALARHRRK
jgi:L-alanine-DL-glutamate epimerase-like enolase superfamily enzyme